MSSLRQEKYASLIRRELGMYFQQSARNYGQGLLISVTKIRVSPDLGYCKVYLSIFGGNPEELIQEIQQRSHEIRHALGLLIAKQVRVIPELSFYLDDSAEYAQEIDRLLKK
jgi:ribosome-binding factor A